MPVKRKAVWGAGVGVALAAASSALINELNAGWPWWIAAAVAVLASAALTSWLAADSQSGTDDQARPPSVRVDRGALYGGRDVKIGGSVKTNLRTGADPTGALGTRQGDAAPDVDVRGISAGRDLTVSGDVETTDTPGGDRP
jgi:hypothetical protein